jgi:hypothetical protein
MAGTVFSGQSGLSDEEKKRRGTFDPRYSEEKKNQGKATKILTGPWLSQIPPPDFKLDQVGRKKYDELTQILLDQNKLTTVTREHAQIIAIMHMQISIALSLGKMVPTVTMSQMQKSLILLGITENAKNIGPEPKKSTSKWGVAGFASRRFASK